MSCPYQWQLHPGSVFPFATKVALPCAAVAWLHVVNICQHGNRIANLILDLLQDDDMILHLLYMYI